MDYKILGRTGLRVGVAGLGCGGHSRLGQTYGNSLEQSVAVVRGAIDLGVNWIDTAAAYGTEKIVGEAVRGLRDKVYISTKTAILPWGEPKAAPYTGAQVLEQLEKNLGRLATDYVDLYNLHSIVLAQLDYVAAEIVPALIKAREQGKIRFLGITEHFGSDTDHKMLAAAVPTGVWDVVMVGFNLLNPSARRNVLRLTQAHQVGVQDMFAVRRALSNPAGLKDALDAIERAGQLDRAKLDASDPLGFLKEGSEGIVDAAYRFCRHEPGIDIVLTGTGKLAHLAENVASIARGPLPAKTLARLEELFGQVDSVSGN
ncbi:MAG TPA: aldo/keto reductase [Rhizomicrobium sp.]|jgi:aryl-alcohol dehydrogenase-like predicted oxidoreductase|nr:aldo/keto reductase [Rhizomicrobium sp.]